MLRRQLVACFASPANAMAEQSKFGSKLCDRRAISVKVLRVIPSIDPYRWKPATFGLAMVTALRERDFDAAIVATDDDGCDTRMSASTA